MAGSRFVGAYHDGACRFIECVVTDCVDAIWIDVLTRCAHVVCSDPLSFPYGPRFKTGLELLESTRFVQENSEIIAQIPIPLLVLHGSGDTVTKSESSLQMVDQILKQQKNLPESPRGLRRRISRTHWLVEVLRYIRHLQSVHHIDTFGGCTGRCPQPAVR